jgi:hypothetical protein
MKAKQAQELVAQVTELAKKMMDAEAAKIKRMRAAFAQHGGGKIEDSEAEEEAVKNTLMLSAVMLLAGLAVNVARIADVLEDDAFGTDAVLKTPRERL